MDHQANENEGHRVASAAAPPTPSQHPRRRPTATDDHHQQQLPPTSAQQRSLDPTGMFRNRGRRVIASASAAAAAERRDRSEMQKILQHSTNNAGITSSSSQSSSSPSPEKMANGQKYHNNYHNHHRRCQSSSSNVLKNGEEMVSPLTVQEQQNELSSTSTPCGECIVNKEDGRMTSQEKVTNDPPHLQSALPTTDPSNNRGNHTQQVESATEIDNSDVTNEDDEKRSMEKTNILLNRHETNNGSEDEQQQQQSPSSDIGSTVSIMGSIIGDDMGDHDNVRYLAVQRRMMNDVEEIREEGAIDEIYNESSCDDQNDENVIESESDTPDQRIHDESELLNVSLECNADTDTSLLEDYPLNHDVLLADEERESTFIEDGNSEFGAETLESKHDAESINSTNNNKWGSGSGTCSNRSANEKQTRKEQESPFRAAFRRSAQGMSNRLPPMSTQLLSERLTPSRLQLASASSAIDKAATTASLLPLFARQCFSFEDTTIDDDTFFVMPLHTGGEGSGGYHFNQQATHKYYGLSGVASFATIDERGDSSTENQFSSKSNPSSFHLSQQAGLLSGELDSPYRIIRHARTWNHHGQSSPTGEVINSHHGAKDDITYLHGNICHASSFDPWSPKSSRMKSSESMHGAKQKKAASQVSGEKDWKRIETERRVALDVLAFMVDQSLSVGQVDCGSHVLLCNKCQDSTREVDSSIQYCCSDCLSKVQRIAKAVKEIGEEPSSVEHDAPDIDQQMRSDVIDALLRSHAFALEVKRSSISARKWLRSIGFLTLESDDSCKIDGNQALGDVALRACLHSSEISVSTKEGEIIRLNEELSKCRTEIGRLKSSLGAQMLRQPIPLAKNKSILSDSSSESSSDSDLIDNVSNDNGPLVLCPSRPTSVKQSDSQDESFTKWEKNIEAQMNLESRKEILLLKAALEKAQRAITALENQKSEPFSSEIEPINASSDDGETFLKIADDLDSKALNVSMDVNLNDPALEKELEAYRRALIVTLENRTSAPHAGSVTSSDDPNIDQDVSKSTSSEFTSDRKMINVRMIDGENFSTEWGDLVDLPPPPDHDLHSPIVDAVLNKWSGDNETRLALIQWMENILSGGNLETIPSLKLSGLDHQLRDGFVMHILPLLLRRKDVHVHLTSRAHRQTTYDIAVSVTPTSFGIQHNKHDAMSDSGSEDVEFRQRQLSRESKHHLMAFHATKSGASIKDDTNMHRSPLPFWSRTIPGLIRTPSNAGSISTAVTTPISNRTPSRGPHIPGKNRFTSLLTDNVKKDGGSHYLRGDNSIPTMMAVTSPSLGDDLSVGSSVDDGSDNRDCQGQSSIMGSISGAFGLLSRRKPPPVEKGIQGTSHSIGHVPPSALHTPTRKVVSSEDDHPYHRVVSAPPGKIGISFVEYCGHAMVSNVSDDSPLVGWVFPSDVLVAIDDISVSGLPTREIVKLLTNKVHQQRNLQMISAVAMNEIIRPGTL